MNKKTLKAGVEEAINAAWARLCRESNYQLVRGDEDLRKQFQSLFAAGFGAGMTFATRTIQEERERLNDHAS